MKKIKKKMNKALLLLLACMSVGTVSNAQTASTDVFIAIEGAESAPVVENKGNDTKGKGVQTGDTFSVGRYLIAAGIAVGVAGFCLLKLKKTRKTIAVMFAMFLSALFMNHTAYAAENTQNVNVTVPSTISVSFEKDGKNSISEFRIDNQSPIPITMEKVHVKECNEWKLCEQGETIETNTKKMAFALEGQYLKPQENTLQVNIKENSSKNCELHVDRGAWTISDVAETALQLEFEYNLGRKAFQLSFDSNGGKQTIEPMQVYNGETVTLPAIERDGYSFVGWKAPDGKIYTDQYTMPIGDVTLVAQWKEQIAYAIYIPEDSSLRFVRSAEPITVGSTYDGKTVTGVYQGFETAIYESEAQVPWYDNDYYNQTIVKKVIVEDKIQPVSTAHWFHWMYDCESMDLQKLDTSKVTDMSYMFGWAGFYAKNFEVKGINAFDVSNVENMEHTFGGMGRDSEKLVLDLSKWNVSKVKNMAYLFDGMGAFSTSFALGDLSKWDVSNVMDMTKMFRQTGLSADWYVDCSGWNVGQVKKCNSFNLEVSSKVIAPSW